MWEVSWRRGQTTTYWSKVLLTIAPLLSHLGLVAQPWVTEGPNWLQLQLTQAVCILIIFLFDVHLLPLLPLIYTGASLDWRLGQRSICNSWTIVKFLCANIVTLSCENIVTLLHKKYSCTVEFLCENIVTLLCENIFTLTGENLVPLHYATIVTLLCANKITLPCTNRIAL